jgi:predicted DNA-binding protein (MmcQ/YjbR family)
MADPKRTHRAAIRFALALPDAFEDHPWGETVAKVGRKVFAFFGSGDASTAPGMTLKLRESNRRRSVCQAPRRRPTVWGSQAG